MEIRAYQPADCAATADLFYRTVHTVNAADYTKEQLDAWATGQVDLEEWNRSFQAHFTLIAVEGSAIVGFGDMDASGYLDRLFVDAEHLRRGIASALCNRLEASVPGTIRTRSSVTARPFFEQRGYRVIRELKAARRGVLLPCYEMELCR